MLPVNNVLSTAANRLYKFNVPPASACVNDYSYNVVYIEIGDIVIVCKNFVLLVLLNN